MSSRLDRANRLKQLKELKVGKSKRLEDTEDLFENVDDEFIQQDEDFVVDDDNAGYIDNGIETQYFSDEYENEAEQGKRKRKSKKGKVKKEEAIAKPKQQINTFFNNSALKSTLKPKPVVNEEESEDFMASLLSDFGSSKSKPIIRKQTMTTKLKPKVLEPSSLVRSKLKKLNNEDHIYIKEEPLQNKVENNIEDIDFDDDFMDEDIQIVEGQLKKEVEQLTIKESSKPNFTITNIPESRPDLQNWEKADTGVLDTFSDDAMKEDLNNLDIFEENGNLHMWWYDAYERKEKGYVYLFGKAFNKKSNKYISCCVTVQNIERNLFVLPRQTLIDENGNESTQDVTINDVYKEFSSLCASKKITKFLSKEVTRKYAFELPDVPVESNYLKVVYNYDQPSFNGDEKGRSFSHIFGANTGPLEHFLIKRNVMGPCWLEVKNAKMSNTSETWCKAQIIVTDPKTVNPLVDENGNKPVHIPPLVVMSICLRTILNEKKNANEIVAASALVCDQVQIDDAVPIEKMNKSRFTVVRQLENKPYPANFMETVSKERKQSGFTVQVERTETSLLNFLLAKVHMYDPDIIVGHNFAGFDLDVLLHRMKALNVQHWHRLGRLKRKNWPKLQAGAGGAGESTFQERLITSGRLVCDTYLASKDLIKSKSYRMTDLAQSQLKINREDIEFGKTATFFEKSETLLRLLKHCSFDTFLASALMFKLQILPLTLQLTNLAGNLWSRTMTGARAERNEYLLLHEFHKAKYICPEKSFGGPKAAVIQAAEQDEDEEAVEMASSKKKKSSRRKPAYAGGLVLEPKKGFYDKYVLLLDFNSLYPSIIQEYNICFTTVNRIGSLEENEDSEGDKVPEIPDDQLPQGILPRLVKNLVDRRKQVKSLMKGTLPPATYLQLDIRQKALKLTANSMYGCLGFTYSRFYAKPLAMLITYKGREILQSTVNLASSLDMNVIYGDTDSIMVYTNQSDLEEVKKMGNVLRKNVNNRYKLMEIGIDGYYKHMLLLKKKKYAALLVQEKPNGELIETIETKGLDLVRRDWCDLSHDVSAHVLDLILSDRDRDDVVSEVHAYLEIVAEQIRQGDIPIEKYVINKQLTKNPQDYADAKSQPHVQVALRMLASGQNVKNGDTVPYVICKVDEETSGDKKGSALRAYHPDSVIKDQMQLDIEWYLQQQVHPPLARICSPIEGTDPSRLAQCLGLDAKRFHSASLTANGDEAEFATLDSQISDEERFRWCDRLRLTCHQCDTSILFEGILRSSEKGQVECGLSCPHCHTMLSQTSVGVQVALAIRSFIQRYYDSWYVCDDVTCSNRTRMISVFGRRCMINSCRGSAKREYTDKQLYTQLMYLASLFDPNKAKSKTFEGASQIQADTIINNHYKKLLSIQCIVHNHLERSGYRYVDLSKLLSSISI